jgi:GcrA cell cycle regulator
MTVNVQEAKWTAGEEALARRLWAEGKSASQVAKAVSALGRIRSRSAVIGRMHRLGAERPHAPSSPHAARPQKAAKSPPGSKRISLKRKPLPVFPREPKAAKSPALVVVEVGTCTLAGLGARMCKWPIGDPGEGHMDEQLFCGAPRDDGAVYCAAHRGVACRPAKVVKPTLPEFKPGRRGNGVVFRGHGAGHQAA